MPDRLSGTHRLINDLRWGLHDLWSELEIPSRVLTSPAWQERIGGRLARAAQTTRVRIARDELRRTACPIRIGARFECVFAHLATRVLQAAT